MSIFKKIFGSSADISAEDVESDFGALSDNGAGLVLDELFTHNFKKNGGKFIYCENSIELEEQFENILEENDWFESEAMCLESKLFKLLADNKISFTTPSKPSFFLASCENLIADEGSILFSSNQIKQHKPNDLPDNIILVATTSQIISNKSDGLREIKRRYTTDYPTNITTFKYFEKAKEEDFLHYGSLPKNLYLLLLEDL